MESIEGYDHWKTIPPEPEEEKQEYCTCCRMRERDHRRERRWQRYG